MKTIQQRNYFSTNDFVTTNELQEEAVKLFGKNWEPEDDVEQIERLLEFLDKKFYQVIHEEGLKSDYDIKVVLNDDLKRIGELESALRKIEELTNNINLTTDNILDSIRNISHETLNQ